MTIRSTYDENLGDELGNNINSNLNTTLSEEEDVNINTDKGVEVSDGTSQDDLQLLNNGSDVLNSAVLLCEVVCEQRYLENVQTILLSKKYLRNFWTTGVTSYLVFSRT